MLDVIARLLLSAGILVGTTYLPVLSQAVTAAPAAPRASAVIPSACPSKAVASGVRALACLG